MSNSLIRLLVISEREVTRRQLRELFEPDAGAVEWAATDAEALAALRRRAHDAVLLDDAFPPGAARRFLADPRPPAAAGRPALVRRRPKQRCGAARRTWRRLSPPSRSA